MKFYPIEIFPDERLIMYYPQEFMANDEIEYVAFGSLATDAIARPHPSDKKKISVSSALGKALHIPEIPLKLHLFCQDHTLFLGPIVGIFSAGFTKFPNLPLGNRSYQFSKYFTVGENLGVLPILFGLQHIDWENGLVKGFYFRRNQWLQLDVPLPNVVYDRLPNRKVENLSAIRETKGILAEEYVIPSFNPGFFSKSDVYGKLEKSPETKAYLPKTVPFNEKRDLEQMLDEYPFVYMKPNEGSLGNGVYQIKKKGKDLFCRFRDRDGKNRLLKFSSPGGLIRHLFPERTYKQYVIQQGIPLLKINGCPADFRIHTNKGKDGKWYVTAVAAKVASLSGATTHLASGGVVKTVHEIFPDKEELDRNVLPLLKAALIMSKELEKKMDGQLAEIGFDLGIDEQGKVWMFEANSKPGRSIFTHPKLRKNERMIMKFLLSYGVFLTKRVTENPEKFFDELVLQ